MARGKTTGDLTTLQMALVGYEIEKKKIEEKIREIKAQLGRRGASAAVASVAESPTPRKRNLSADARRRIALAQKRRWAEHRRKAAAAKGATKGESKPQA